MENTMSLVENTLDSASPRDFAEDKAREANHRISNHLSLLVAMIQTQQRALDSGPENLSREDVRNAMREIAGKIVGVSQLHRTLAEHAQKAEVNICDHLLSLTTALVSSLALGKRVNVTHHLTANSNVTPEQAQNLGLMVSEIIMNSVKHAHPTGIPVQIALSCRRETDGRLTIEVSDDGIGLPEGDEARVQSGVGFKLIRSLAKMLESELHIQSDSLGLTFLITLPATTRAIGLATA